MIGQYLEIIIDGMDAGPKHSRGRIIAHMPSAHGQAWLVDFDGRIRAIGNIPAAGGEIQTFRILSALEMLAHQSSPDVSRP